MFPVHVSYNQPHYVILTSRVSGRVNRIGPVHLSLCVCVLVEHVPVVCVYPSIMAKGLWGEGTLKHGSREVRQRSGVFIQI